MKIWDVAAGTRLYTLSDPQDSINTVAIDPTGHFVAAGGFDQTIRIWSLDEKSGKLEQSLIAFEEPILKLAWSPDGKILVASAGRTIKLYNAADLAEIKTLPEQSDWVYGLLFFQTTIHLSVRHSMDRFTHTGDTGRKQNTKGAAMKILRFCVRGATWAKKLCAWRRCAHS